MIQIIERVLYILNDGFYLSLQGESIVIRRKEDESLKRLPLVSVEQIIIFSESTVTTALVKACNDAGIRITYCSPYGAYLGTVSGASTGNVFLRKQLYDAYDNDKALEFSRNIIYAKTVNSINLIKYYARIEKTDEVSGKLYSKAQKIKELGAQLRSATNVDEIRVIESMVASEYFSCFDDMLKAKDRRMGFEKRTKHPPANNLNALLSLFYSLYTINVATALESFGLDSQMGLMHRMRSGRASLACDL